jgi:mRNA interferase RelE/StbE
LAWLIEFTETAEKQLSGLDRSAQADIYRYLRNRIATEENPRRFGDPLRREFSGLWKYRVGEYRVICDIQDHKVLVLVVRVGHRSRVYGGH